MEEQRYTEYTDIIKFHPGNVPVPVAAAVIGMDKNLLKNCMDSGELDLGVIHKPKKKRGKRPYRKFYISPKKLYDLTGFVWNGEKTAEDVLAGIKNNVK